jgi:hypothetical protein
MIKGQASAATRASAVSRRAHERRLQATIRSNAAPWRRRSAVGDDPEYIYASEVFPNLCRFLNARMTTRHALGHSAAAHRRSTGHQRPQHRSPALAKPAEAGEPLPGAIQQFRRVHAGTGSRSTTIGRCVPSRNLDRVQGRRRHEIEARSRPPVYGFLTTATNAVAEPIHSTAMPVIALQQSLPDDALNRDARTRKIVPRLESPRALSWLGPFNPRQQKSRGCAGMSVWGEFRT